MRKALFVLLLMSLCAGAQVTTKRDGKAAKTMKKAGVTAELMQREWDAWCTLDVKNPAKFYDQAPENVYFDIEPLQYHGWAEYAKGVQSFLDTVKSGKCTVDEPRIHAAGPVYWTTSLVHLDMVTKEGGSERMDLRWTAVWEKRGADWKIVHEQVSAPIPEH